MNLTMDLSLLLHAIHSLFYMRILQETMVLKNSIQKIRETRKLESIHE